MVFQDTEKIILRFLNSVKNFWQIIFLISVISYGISLIYRFNFQTAVKPLSYLQFLNWTSFALALVLAISIFHYKRKYFSLRSFRKYLEDLHSKNPEFYEKQLAQRFARDLSKKMKNVWLMAGALIILGVVYFWWTFDAWNMHVYFIVGLYSLMINYPRRDLFADVPYLIHEVVREKNKNR